MKRKLRTQTMDLFELLFDPLSEMASSKNNKTTNTLGTVAYNFYEQFLLFT